MQRIKARITGIGTYVPSRSMKNSDFETLLETSDEWIFSRTGIRERRIGAPNESTSSLAISAALDLMKKRSINPSFIDLIIVCTMSQESLCPSTAAMVQDQIGAVNAAAFDLSAACSGFLYGLSTAKAFIESGLYQNVLLIGAEMMSSIIDWKERSTCVLFGDAAGAVFIEAKGSGLCVRDILLGSDGSFGYALTLCAKERVLRMQGREVFKQGVRRMSQAADDLLKRQRLDMQDVDYVIPHQANQRLIENVCAHMHCPMEKVFLNLEHYGNTSAASIPLALDQFLSQKNLEGQQKILLIAFGGGLSWGSALLEKMEGTCGV